MPSSAQDRFRFAAVILAGGEGARMEGRDKGLVDFHNQPMISWTLSKVAPLTDRVLISCNRNRSAYARFGFPLVNDLVSGFQGPLAGVQAAMAELDSSYTHLLLLPCDTPLLEAAQISFLLQQAEENPRSITLLANGDQPQFLHAVIPLCYRDNLTRWLGRGERAVYRWYRQFPMHQLDLGEESPQLRNFNTLSDLD
ncbi:molybdenum cofactor guanylyltransferase MobA [Neptuniibacter halophilus]|uniref:molybdenum cofactor guanylyltransferase MobA n=1 Tax=Neptuniibacter halophilus TaxID=651666 RepID=UPI0025737CF4|nr:molybdenum cofactor guanylyltransferase MobA [Neptuniibacter halophilus]